MVPVVSFLWANGSLRVRTDLLGSCSTGFPFMDGRVMVAFFPENSAYRKQDLQHDLRGGLLPGGSACKRSAANPSPRRVEERRDDAGKAEEGEESEGDERESSVARPNFADREK